MKLDTVILSKTNAYFVFFLTWILDFYMYTENRICRLGMEVEVRISGG